MDGWATKLLDGWRVSDWGEYVAWATMTTILIRVLLITLTALEDHAKQRLANKLSSWPRERFGVLWRRYLCGGYAFTGNGKYGRGLQSPDFFLNTLLGWFELIAFPILIVAGAWAVIGAWLTLKTVAQWDVWKTSRATFNRFLIGTAVLLFASSYLAKKFVSPVAVVALGT